MAEDLEVDIATKAEADSSETGLGRIFGLNLALPFFFVSALFTLSLSFEAEEEDEELDMFFFFWEKKTDSLFQIK